jgi:ABC-type Fe3+/spermidine/putrescine transport system ATPase subunit
VRGAAEIPAGDKAHLSIRPEMITVELLEGARAQGEDGARPRLEGTVEETIFVGSVWKTIIRLPGGAKIVASEPPSAHGVIAPGTAVCVRWEAESAVVLAD